MDRIESSLSSSTFINSSDKRYCLVCDQNNCQYTCPKCGLFYCSLKCYQSPKHLECTEEFHKDQVIGHMSTNSVDPELRDKVIELLCDLSIGEDKIEAKQMKKNLKTRKYGNEKFSLTDEEWTKFDSLLKSGGIFNLLPSSFWDPWYIDFINKPITKMPGQDGSNEDIPPYPIDLPPLESLTKGPVSILVKYSVIQTLFAYCYVSRFFTGDLFGEAETVFHQFISVSFIEQKNTLPLSDQCLQQACRKLIEEHKIPLEFVHQICLDLIGIIKAGNKVILRILVDIARLCRDVHKTSKSRSSFLAKKKIEFFLSWCVENQSCLQAELATLQLESISMASNRIPPTVKQASVQCKKENLVD
ncbi:zinc finger HIT domain-containing protein 2 [Brevipalpus obovatus]|uniref:zinc finger HIT domain-containing protein 2 n=1 Tax=Brevipalpus obovatus TaxID=246614 RepID=UPI003D9FAB9E